MNLAVASLALLLAAAAPASPRDAALTLLRASKLPPNSAELSAIGRGVDEALISIARDEKLDLPLRARAVSALGQTPTRLARTFLFGVLAKAGAPAPADKSARKTGKAADDIRLDEKHVLLRRALLALGWVGGLQAPEVMGELLSHPDPDVRADTASGLAITRLPKAAELLRARLGLERDGHVRAHIARQLTVLEAAAGPAGGAAGTGGKPSAPSSK